MTPEPRATTAAGSGGDVPGRMPAPAPAVTATGSTTTRVLGVVALAGLALLLVLAFVVSPADAVQGEAVRLLYVHVPSVLTAYAACLLVTAGSVGVLWKRSEWWDLTALAAARVAALFTAVTLATGAVWGRATWGVFWVWDARLTSTAMLMILLLGYLALRQGPAGDQAQSRRAAVLGLLLVPNIVLIHQSVDWWRSLHQDPTILRRDLDVAIDDTMLFTLFVGIVVFGLVGSWLLVHGFRVAWLERQAASSGLEQALAARRAEGAAPPAHGPTHALGGATGAPATVPPGGAT